MALAAPISMLALSSCGATDTSSCPPIKQYTEAEQAQACEELKAMCPAAKECGDVRRECPTLLLPRLIDDYGLLRKQLRACPRW